MDQGLKYIENPSRAVFLNAEIDLASFRELAVNIIKQRQNSSNPICLYIDSLGGNVQLSERILGLIKCPFQNGRVQWLITVAYGYAASAAANLLALGDYAIVYPTAIIHYHCSRQMGPEVRLEDISTLADGLRETNDRLASRLASRMFRRMVFLSITSGYTEENGSDFSLASTVVSPQKFFDRLRKKISPQSQQLLARGIKRQERIDELVKFIENKGVRQGPASIDQDAKILKAIVDFEASQIKKAYAQKPGDIEVITYEQADMIKTDYRELFDYFFGTFRSQLNDIVLSQGASFLLPDEAEEHKLLTSDEEKVEYLKSKVEPRLEPLWYLVVSLCRSLQEGENPLTPEDAYWLGLVDEVVGLNLPCYRTMFESPPQSGGTPKKKAASTTRRKNKQL